ncbi:hypothetical protein ABEV55_02095 [Aneurinibacillus thermoaerophilus]|uniref:hypothetical protein n=1 Tax=Aneurinibacillus thermoaerophilus TaxID=143495 RepID=UPI002E1C9DB1|nr:hypothetical protein [Aneurinibacillus thermoaerophilus]
MRKIRLFGRRQQQQDPCMGVKQGQVSISEDFLMIQQLADNGENPWRLNPVQTARQIGIEKLGFAPTDVFRFQRYDMDYSLGLNYALVQAQHGPCLFLIELCQPVRQGSTGIWAVERVAIVND